MFLLLLVSFLTHYKVKHSIIFSLLLSYHSTLLSCEYLWQLLFFSESEIERIFLLDGCRWFFISHNDKDDKQIRLAAVAARVKHVVEPHWVNLLAS